LHFFGTFITLEGIVDVWIETRCSIVLEVIVPNLVKIFFAGAETFVSIHAVEEIAVDGGFLDGVVLATLDADEFLKVVNGLYNSIF